MRDLTVVAALSPSSAHLAAELDRELRSRGFDTWMSDRDVDVGRSRVAEADRALARAMAVVVVGPAEGAQGWETRLVLAATALVEQGAQILIAAVPTTSAVPPAGLKSTLLTLPIGIAPVQAAAVLAATVVRDLGVSATWSGESIGILRPGSWARALSISSYPAYADVVDGLIKLREFDAATELYWKSLYASGYREEWRVRERVSHELVRLAEGVGDARTAGLVLVRGIAYAELEEGNWTAAEAHLDEGATFLARVKDAEGTATAWTYRGDLLRGRGRLRAADQAYRRGIVISTGVSREHLVLRREWLALRSLGVTASDVDRLSEIVEAFAETFDYREGLARLDLAEFELHRGDVEAAIREAQSAVELLDDRIGMERHARRARQRLAAIRAKERDGA